MLSSKRYKQIKIYTEKEIREFYDALIYNLSIMPFPFDYIHPSKMQVVIPDDWQWPKASKNDGYINDYAQNPIGLALDVLENGTYWPIWAYERDGIFYVGEGRHRIISIHEALEKGIWKDQKLFTIVTPYGFDETCLLDVKIEPVEVYIPVFNLDLPKDEFDYFNKFKEYLNNTPENIERFNKMNKDGPLKIIVNSFRSYMMLYKVFQKFLRHVFHKYKEYHEFPVPVYDYSQFKKTKPIKILNGGLDRR